MYEVSILDCPLLFEIKQVLTSTGIPVANYTQVLSLNNKTGLISIHSTPSAADMSIWNNSKVLVRVTGDKSETVIHVITLVFEERGCGDVEVLSGAEVGVVRLEYEVGY